MPNCAENTPPRISIPKHPSGEKLASWRSVIGFVVSKAGVGLIDSRMGVIAIETSTDGITKRTKPDGSAVSSNAWLATIPSVCTII